MPQAGNLILSASRLYQGQPGPTISQRSFPMTKHSRLLPSLALLTLAISPGFFHAKPPLPAERPGEQVMLLPAGDHFLLNFNVPAFFKSKTFAELHAKSAQASELLGV